LRRSDMGFVNVHLRLGGGYAYLRPVASND